MGDHVWSRLREAQLDEAADPVAARAAWLLRSEDPLAPSAERIGRVRQVVLAQPPVPPRWGGAWRLVPSPVGAVLAVGVLAVAGLFAWWWSRDAATHVAGGAAIIAPATVDVGLRPAAMAGTAATAVAAGPSPLPPPPAPPPQATPAPPPPPPPPPPKEPAAPPPPEASARLPSRQRAPGPPATPAIPVPAVPAPSSPAVTAPPVPESAAPSATDTDGAELLVKATRLLRHEDDPAAARVLITRYLASHPDGLLAEEALYLDVEAAGALQDGTLRPLAARYLARYPRGRFRAAVINLRDGR